MKIETMRYRIKLLTPMLGTVPKNKDVYTKYIATKSESLKDEVETVEEIEESGWTGFHKDDEGIFIYDYMIKGNIKAGIEIGMENGEIPKISAYKKWVDKLIFIFPRKLRFINVNEPHGSLERPLRGMTAKGERVTVTRSDFIQEGSVLPFEIRFMAPAKNDKKKSQLNWDAINKALEYGQYYGLGQWRGSGGYGRFELLL